MEFRIMGFNGSPYRTGTTARILQRALDVAAKQKVRTEFIHLPDFIKEPFHGAYKREDVALHGAYEVLPPSLKRLIPQGMKDFAIDRLIPEEVRPLFRKVEREADGFIIATPVWWGTPSDYAKIFINYLTLCDYRGFSLKGKVAGLVSVCEEDGAMLCNMIMSNALNQMGVTTVPFGMFYYNRNMSEKSEDKWQENDQELLGVNVLRMLERIVNPTCDWTRT